jgi:hypothetical protein
MCTLWSGGGERLFVLGPIPRIPSWRNRLGWREAGLFASHEGAWTNTGPRSARFSRSEKPGRTLGQEHLATEHAATASVPLVRRCGWRACPPRCAQAQPTSENATWFAGAIASPPFLQCLGACSADLYESRRNKCGERQLPFQLHLSCVNSCMMHIVNTAMGQRHR